MQKMNLEAKSVSDDIVGIDLGTTNSAVTIYNAGTVPTLLPVGGAGKYTIQSCVRWDGGNKFTVGPEAYEERYEPNVCYSVKRIMGSGKLVLFVRKSGTGCDDFLELTPAQVSAEILKAIKNAVTEYYKPVDKCVITVPAYFNQRQINDTLEAAKLAGFDCKQILKEPTSASYIYSQLGYANNGSVLIYDLGGGTFDVTHMVFLRRDSIPSKLLTSLRRQYGIELQNNKNTDLNDQYFCRVLGTYGDVNLGGDDIDKAMGDALIARDNLKLSSKGREQLYLRCEEFKKSGIYGEDFNIEGNVIHVTSQDVDNAVDKIFEKTLKIMDDIDMSDVNTIVLVGGSTKSPRLRQRLAETFPQVEISAVLDPDATVALGAGSVAKAIAQKTELMYADVLPLPIGILVDEKNVEVCIAKNTSMPYTVTKTYHTLHDNQTQITIHVFQGLSSNPAECTYLGRLTLTDIPKAPAGEVDVEVSFLLNGQGRLKIISSIKGQNREEELVIDNIFAVTENRDNLFAKATDEGVADDTDDFEKCMRPLLEGNSKAEKLFEERRQTPSDSAERQALEDEIVMLLQEGMN